jgi:hypothetical protein
MFSSKYPRRLRHPSSSICRIQGLSRFASAPLSNAKILRNFTWASTAPFKILSCHCFTTLLIPTLYKLKFKKRRKVNAEWFKSSPCEPEVTHGLLLCLPFKLLVRPILTFDSTTSPTSVDGAVRKKLSRVFMAVKISSMLTFIFVALSYQSMSQKRVWHILR